MFNITSDTHVDMYFDTKCAQEQFYDYIMGNVKKLSLKIQEEIQTNVSTYIDKMIKNTKKLTDTLILAGDIANNNSYSKEFLKKASKIWNNIWYIDGNHEYYFQDKDNGDNRLYRLIEDLKDYPNIKYVANTVQEIQCSKKLLKIGFLPLMYNMNNPDVFKMFNNRMNDKYYIKADYMYESYEKGRIFYENEIYDKCDICVSHVPLLRLEGTSGEETTYYTKVNIDTNIIYFFGHTHRNEEVDDFVITENGEKASVKGYSVGVGYPISYGRGLGIPHTQTFTWSDEKYTLMEIR